MDVWKGYKLCYRTQTFNIPDTIVFHLTKNPSTSKVYSKLIQTCKYFFVKNPILVLQGLKFDDKNGWQILLNDTRFKNDVYQIFPFNEILSKIWIAKRLEIITSTQSQPSNPAAATNLLKKLFRCDAWYLRLVNQIISYSSFLRFTKNVSSCCLLQNVIKGDNFDVTLETFIAKHPKLESILWKNELSINVKELVKLIKVTNIIYIVLYGLTDDFDIEAFYEFLKGTRITETHLFYSDQISVEYREKLDKFVDEIINSFKNYDFFPIWIKYPGMLRIKHETLKKLSKEFYEAKASISCHVLVTVVTNPAPTVTPPTQNDVVVTAPTPFPAVKKVEINYCKMCKKRIGLLGITCQCGGLFCFEHRYDSEHNCTFVYKTMEREELRKKLMG